MTDSTMTALIGAGGAILAAVVATFAKRALDGKKRVEPAARVGSGSAGVASSGRGGTSVATSAKGGHAISVVGSPGATVMVPAPSVSPPTERDPMDKRLFVREATPDEIRRVLLAVPPLQREGLKQSAYVGRWAHWTGEVFHVSQAERLPSMRAVFESATTPTDAATASNEAPGYDVSIRVGQSGFGRVVHLELPRSARPVVELLREGDFVEFEGRLDHFDEVGASFCDAKILRHSKTQG